MPGLRPSRFRFVPDIYEFPAYLYELWGRAFVICRWVVWSSQFSVFRHRVKLLKTLYWIFGGGYRMTTQLLPQNRGIGR